MKSLVDVWKKRMAEMKKDAPPTPQLPPTSKTVKLFNIFKRSLPVSHNKLAFQNVTEEDVNFLFRNILRPKKLLNDTIIYWDAIPVGNADGWNVYSNEGVKLMEGEDNDR